MMQPLARRSWAERGSTPVLDQWDRHDRVSVITALSLSPKRRRVSMYFRLLDHNATAEDFVWFLHDLKQEVGRKLHIVWDNLGAHRRAERFFRSIDCRWLKFIRLPPYAPELNPVEHVWTNAKWGRLANAPPDDIDQLWTSVDDTLTTQATKHHQLNAHFRWARLNLD